MVLWGKGEVCTRFWWGNLRKRDHWGDQDVDGRDDVKMNVTETGCEDVDWIPVAQDRER